MVIGAVLYWTAVSVVTLFAGAVLVTWWSVRRSRLAGEPVDGVLIDWWRAGTALWRDRVRGNDQHGMQIVTALAAASISVLLGYAYVNSSWVDGWQLWTWLLTLGVLVVVLTPWAERPSLTLPAWRWLLAINLLALLLRLPFLEFIPGGLHVDEMGVAGYAARHVFPPEGQTINPFHTGASSQPTLYHYLIRLSFALFDYDIAGLRISSALVGTLAILATYLMVLVFDRKRTALFAAAIMATYHYHVHWSRLALNNIWDTVWVPLILAGFAWGYRRGWSGGAVLSGLALGLSFYFYAGNKISLFLLPLVMLMAYRQDPDRQRLLIHTGKLGLTAVAAGAPITLFALIQPQVFFARSRVVYAWQEPAIVDAVGQLDYGAYLWHQIWRNVGAFVAVPDITGFYGPGVPFLIGLAAPLFVIGLLWAIWKWQWVPVLWVLFTVIFGGIMLTGAPSSSHFVVVIPAICWLTAVPLNWLWQRDMEKLALVLLVAIMLTDALFYFAIYVPGSPRDLFNAMPPWPFP